MSPTQLENATNGETSLEAQVKHLATKLERLEIVEKELQKLKDIEEIKVLMNKYGYYMDKQLYKQVVQLFSNRDDVKGYCHGGIWVGKESIDRMYCKFFGSMFTKGHNGPAYGWLCDHIMAQYVIDVSEDGLTAKGRSRTFMQIASHDDAVKDDPNPLARESAFRAWWEGALYENEYIKENGRWRILTLKYRPVWHSAYDRGWDKTPHDWVPFFKGPKYPEAEGGPDIVEEPSPYTLWLWPDMHVLPFHYPDEAGEWLTDDERIAVRRQLKIYPKKKDW